MDRLTATYAYDSRDRCSEIQLNGSVLTDYTWLDYWDCPYCSPDCH